MSFEYESLWCHDIYIDNNILLCFHNNKKKCNEKISENIKNNLIEIQNELNNTDVIFYFNSEKKQKIIKFNLSNLKEIIISMNENKINIIEGIGMSLNKLWIFIFVNNNKFYFYTNVKEVNSYYKHLINKINENNNNNSLIIEELLFFVLDKPGLKLGYMIKNIKKNINSNYK